MKSEKRPSKHATKMRSRLAHLSFEFDDDISTVFSFTNYTERKAWL